jgi:hypothetical protein
MSRAGASTSRCAGGCCDAFGSCERLVQPQWALVGARVMASLFERDLGGSYRTSRTESRNAIAAMAAPAVRRGTARR